MPTVSAAEHHLPITRTARYHQLGTLDSDVKTVWFVLHGYGQLSSFFIRHFQTFARNTHCFIAPEALSRFYLDDSGRRVGATWMTREDRQAEIADYLAYLDQLYTHVFDTINREAVNVGVLGFSQGATTACRWLGLGQAHADRLVLWAGGFPHDLTEETALARFHALPITYVIGTEDRYRNEVVFMEGQNRLRTLDIPHEIIQFEGDHRLHPETLRTVIVG